MPVMVTLRLGWEVLVEVTVVVEVEIVVVGVVETVVVVVLGEVVVVVVVPLPKVSVKLSPSDVSAEVTVITLFAEFTMFICSTAEPKEAESFLPRRLSSRCLK